MKKSTNSEPLAVDNHFIENLKTWFKKEQPTPQRKKALHRIYEAYKNELPGLDLSGLALSDLPECIDKLYQLIALRLCNNRLQQLPNSFFQLNKIRVLDLSYNDFNTLPAQLNHRGNITMLDICNNPIDSLPACLLYPGNHFPPTILYNHPKIKLLWPQYEHVDEHLHALPPMLPYFNNIGVTQAPREHTSLAAMISHMAAIEDGLNKATSKITEASKTLSTLNQLTVNRDSNL